MAESSKSPLIGIVVAVIGLFGSIAVAFITTQAKFSHELQDKEVEVAKLRGYTALESCAKFFETQHSEDDSCLSILFGPSHTPVISTTRNGKS